MKTLIMTVGLPRSGKTTYARSTGYPVVSPDAIRLALHGEAFNSDAEPMVWAQARYMVRALFLAGHDIVVLDATNTTRARRDEWIDKRWQRCFERIHGNEDLCIGRAEYDNRRDLIPIIVKMAEQFEPVSVDEFTHWENRSFYERAMEANDAAV